MQSTTPAQSNTPMQSPSASGNLGHRPPSPRPISISSSVQRTVKWPKKLNRNEWPFALQTYMPELDDGIAIQDRMRKEVDMRGFAGETAVLHVKCNPGDPVQAEFRGDENLQQSLVKPEDAPAFQLFYIGISDDEKLHITARLFELLVRFYELPVAFVHSLLRYRQQLNHFGSRLINNSSIYDIWYILPAKVAMECTDPRRAHQDFYAGRQQNKPFYLLHLPEQETDLRGFDVAVYFRYDFSLKRTTVVSVNYHSRSSTPHEEVHRRVIHTLQAGGREMMDRNPFWMHLVYIGLILHWWKLALWYFEEELICHESRIGEKIQKQSEKDRLGTNEVTDEKAPMDSADTNRVLHAMSAHSLRYEADISTITAVVSELIEQYEELSTRLQQEPHEKDRVIRALKQQLAEVGSVARRQRELAKKTKNTLALLFHSVQADYDKRQVDFLALSQADANNALTFTEQTMRDSFAMKTIAIMTMLFLPATTFSAILALPYFQNGPPGRTLWIWGIFTGAVTAIIIAVFQYLSVKVDTDHLTTIPKSEDPLVQKVLRRAKAEKPSRPVPTSAVEPYC